MPVVSNNRPIALPLFSTFLQAGDFLRNIIHVFQYYSIESKWFNQKRDKWLVFCEATNRHSKPSETANRAEYCFKHLNPLSIEIPTSKYDLNVVFYSMMPRWTTMARDWLRVHQIEV